MAGAPPELLYVVLDARIAILGTEVGRPQPEPQAQVQSQGLALSATADDIEPLAANGAGAAHAMALLPHLWDAMLVFCRAHAALSLDQKIAILGAHAKRTALLTHGFCADIDWSGAKQQLVEFLREDGALSGVSLLAAGLSAALCKANRARKTLNGHLARVLLLDGSSAHGDLSKQGNALLGCAFAAQGAGVPIDCLAVGREPSTLLRQVVILSGGKHHAVLPSGGFQPATEVLVPALLFHFLSSSATRKEMNTATDLQSHAVVCSCHGEPHEVAYVCSCCLSVYCSEQSAICTYCRTRFRPESCLDMKLRELGTAPLGVCP